MVRILNIYNTFAVLFTYKLKYYMVETQKSRVVSEGKNSITQID